VQELFTVLNNVGEVLENELLGGALQIDAVVNFGELSYSQAVVRV